MERLEVIDGLNRLLRILSSSLPTYLKHTRPWSRRNAHDAREALARLADDQQRYVERIAEAVRRLKGRVEPGSFPMQFASTHDLAVEYLVKMAIECQSRDVAAIRQCVVWLAGEPDVGPMAEEILRNQTGYLEGFKSLVDEESPAEA
ncbi:MAG: hypothetical protein ACYTG0_08480 [Planctomycetota bacterium]|jgi:hypothetical protein